MFRHRERKILRIIVNFSDKHPASYISHVGWEDYLVVYGKDYYGKDPLKEFCSRALNSEQIAVYGLRLQIWI